MLNTTAIFLQNDLLFYAFLTVLIEVPIFFILGYRKFKEIVIFALANLTSNLLLNEFLLAQIDNYELYIALGEITVVPFEYVFCRCLLATSNPKKLFITIIITNVTSFIIGLLLFF